MNLTPLKRYRRPTYPTAEELREQPEMLRSSPKSWISKPSASLVGLALGLLPACSTSMSITPAIPQEPNQEPAPTAPREQPADIESEQPADEPTPPQQAAPNRPGQAVVFEVGEGRGAVGCVAIAAPVFLTEEEAWVVLNDELASAGLQLSRGGPSISGVTLPRFEMCGGRTGEGPPIDVEFDGGDGGRGVAVEFISANDFNELWDQGMMCSVQDYRFLEAARALAQELGEPENLMVGVFYDPATVVCYGGSCPGSIQGEPSEEAARGKSRDDLRAQVRQFVDFLRSNGTI